MSPPLSSPRICFNPDCRETKSEQWRAGWRLRNGEFAELCDRCSAAFEEVRFCEIFHTDATGWRECNICGKRVHCGCIASVHTFLHLDKGGVECMGCAKKNFYMVSNQMLPSPCFLPISFPERLKDLSVKNWSQGSRSVSIIAEGRSPANPWSNTSVQTELCPRMLYEADRPNHVDEKPSADVPVSSAQAVKRTRDASDNIKIAALPGLANEENGAADTRKEVVADTGLTSAVSGINFEMHQSSRASVSLPSSTSKDESSVPFFGVSVAYSPPNGMNDPSGVSGALSQHVKPTPVTKQTRGGSNSIKESSGELHGQIRNGKPGGEARGRNQLLLRYHPRITDQELQEISADSNCTITPLFEKMLSASDAGRIGRLVLPKRCAEAYFPAISQPEGLPLKVQDAKGKEWVFQFRFWPNNNSRMYVLEGVTPCIQSMQLQAGDTVTFSRMDPEGKLVMGFRKTSSTSCLQDVHSSKDGNNISVNPTDTADAKAKLAKGGAVQKERPLSKPSLTSKRKASTLGSKDKCLRINNEDSLVLKLTCEEAQGLLHPPNLEPNIVMIEGHAFEEYEEPPILGRPTFFTIAASGQRYQWVQCDFCSKWRKLPADALIPNKWRCSLNYSSDNERARCEAPQEITTEQLKALISSSSAPSERKRPKEEPESLEALGGLETLAKAAILGDGGPSPSQTTTKHPRHRDGCTCIVCIQPPSGKGPKHEQTCTCNVCLMVKRRFKTLMLRRERHQSENDGEMNRKKPKIKLAVKREMDGEELSSSKLDQEKENPNVAVSEGLHDDTWKESASPLKGQIDLNMQPEREEDPSPMSDSGSMMKLFRDASADSYLNKYSRSVDLKGDPEAAMDEMTPSYSVGEENSVEGDHKLDVNGVFVLPPKLPTSMSVSPSPAATE